jgi:hypothetical protein
MQSTFHPAKTGLLVRQTPFKDRAQAFDLRRAATSKARASRCYRPEWSYKEEAGHPATNSGKPSKFPTRTRAFHSRSHQSRFRTGQRALSGLSRKRCPSHSGDQQGVLALPPPDVSRVLTPRKTSYSQMSEFKSLTCGSKISAAAFVPSGEILILTWLIGSPRVPIRFPFRSNQTNCGSLAPAPVEYARTAPV